jgi:CubicO group peptidase (beta-lactamase class C family)
MTIRRLLPALCLAGGHAWGQANPVFSSIGPDAAAYGHEQHYPYGPPAGELVQMFMVGTLTHFDRIFPSHVVARGAVAPLPRAREELALTYRHDGMLQTLADYLHRNATTSLLIARGGTIVYEHYQYDRMDTDRFLSFSMAKTLTGMLIGIAVREGAIRSIDQPAADYVPELAGTEYGGTSIRNLLRMASGVAFRENYDGTDDATKLRRMQYSPGGPPGTRIVATFNERETTAGTRFHYASAETAVLGLVLRRAVNMPLADYLSTRIWAPMGAEADASWGVDNSGQETAQCCLSAVARDWLRLGLLLAADGCATEGKSFPVRGCWRRLPRARRSRSRARRRGPWAMAIRPGCYLERGASSC